MKNCLLLLIVFASFTAKAQMDDKFYYPGKKMLPIDSVAYEEFTLPVDTAQITGIVLQPKSDPKQRSSFFMAPAAMSPITCL